MWFVIDRGTFKFKIVEMVNGTDGFTPLAAARRQNTASQT